MDETQRTLFAEYVMDMLMRAANGDGEAGNEVINFALAADVSRLASFKQWAAEQETKISQEIVSYDQMAAQRKTGLLDRQTTLLSVENLTQL